MKVFITIVFTSFFWILIIFMFVSKQPIENKEIKIPEAEVADVVEETTHKILPIEEAIVGVWSPVEVAKDAITISKYGTIKAATMGIENFSLKGNKMEINNIDEYVVAVVEEENGTYLEMKVCQIYRKPLYAGRYRLVKR